MKVSWMACLPLSPGGVEPGEWPVGYSGVLPNPPPTHDQPVFSQTSVPMATRC